MLNLLNIFRMYTNYKKLNTSTNARLCEMRNYMIWKHGELMTGIETNHEIPRNTYEPICSYFGTSVANPHFILVGPTNKSKFCNVKNSLKQGFCKLVVNVK